MADKKRDLVVHYDELLGKLIFYSTDVENTAAIRAKEFGGVAPEVAFFREQSADDAEKSLGHLVFSLIDLNSQTRICIRDYEVEANAAHAEMVTEWQEQAESGDSEAQFHFSTELYIQAIRNRSLSELMRADLLLHASAAQGHAAAISKLEIWSDLKSIAERRIARDSKRPAP